MDLRKLSRTTQDIYRVSDSRSKEVKPTRMLKRTSDSAEYTQSTLKDVVDELLIKEIASKGFVLCYGADRPGEYDLIGKGRRNLIKGIKKIGETKKTLREVGYLDVDDPLEFNDDDYFYINKDWNDTGDINEVVTGSLELVLQAVEDRIPYAIYDKLILLGATMEDLEFLTVNDDVLPEKMSKFLDRVKAEIDMDVLCNKEIDSEKVVTFYKS